MKNKLYLLLIAILSCFVFAACGETEDTTADMETYEYDNSGDVKISNGTLSLTVSGSSTQIEVKDERSGKVYRSNPTAEEIQKYCKSDGQFKDVLSSTLGLTYSNSTDTQKEIDHKVVELVRSQHEKAKKLLVDNKRLLDILAMHLYEKETITGDEFMEILNKEGGAAL